MKILVINGPNLNMLGKRQPEIYGNEDLESIIIDLKSYASNYSINITAFQSNHEGEIVDLIQESENAYDGLIINPGALSHYSISIRDAISAVSIRVVEVHISNIFAREDFRQHSVISDVSDSSVIGLGTKGYKLALNNFITFEE